MKMKAGGFSPRVIDQPPMITRAPHNREGDRPVREPLSLPSWADPRLLSHLLNFLKTVASDIPCWYNWPHEHILHLLVYSQSELYACGRCGFLWQGCGCSIWGIADCSTRGGLLAQRSGEHSNVS